MTKFFHIVQVHPVENDEPNLYKVEFEKEYDTKEAAENYVKTFNLGVELSLSDCSVDSKVKAVYVGCVNDETGELI